MRYTTIGALFLTVLLSTTPSAVAGEHPTAPALRRHTRIQLSAENDQGIFLGDRTHPQLGDRSIRNADLFTHDGTLVGTAESVCTVVSVPPRDLHQWCLITMSLDTGQIIFGGQTPAWAPGVSVTFAILGGTDTFRKARGEAIVSVTPTTFETTIDLD